MRRLLFILPIVLACMLAGLTARASYLEEDEERTEPAPSRRIAPPRPVPTNPLTEAIRRISVRPGYSYKGLTVFPLEISRVTHTADYVSLEEALEEELLVLTEKGGGSVPLLVAENKGRRPILMLAGEIIVGGKQNRTLKEDVLLPARSGRVELPVFCVEKGRWSGRGKGFGRASSMAALNVRAAAQAGRSQAEVWSNVSYYQQNLNVESVSEDLQAVSDSAEVRRELLDYKHAFRKHWPGGTVGMVVARYGRIVGADVFCNPRVFRKHRDRLLESYALDCYVTRKQRGADERGRAVRAGPTVHDAERFLRRVLRAQFTWTGTPGSGRLLRVNARQLSGLALVHRGAALHACLLTEVEILRPTPLPRPPRDNRQRREE